MKYAYYLLVLWLVLLSPATSAHANTPPDDSLRVALDHVFAPLDKSQIPTPYLQEYGYKFASLTPYNGTRTDSSVTSLSTWRQLYMSLLSGGLPGRANYLPSLETLNQQLAAQLAASTAIPLLVQRIDYAALRPDAVSAGLLRESNGQLFDVAGRSQSPYALRTLFAVAPGRSRVSAGNVSLLFKRALYAHSGDGSVAALYVDFSDGRGYVAAAWDQPVTASYCTAGVRRVKVYIGYSNQAEMRSATGIVPEPQMATYESHFDLEVVGEGCVASRYDVSGREVPFPAVPGVHSGGVAHIRYGSTGTRTQLVRPLIVAEGYDVASIAPSIEENYNVENFLTALGRGGIYNALQNAGDPGFSAPTGYDIVFIDYNNGTDDIRRNAALFREVVAWVNANKAGGTGSGQQNVVLGVSMGGLVARYGLAQMEKAQPGSTHTRLLVTHDSPHRGANTPLGVQALTRQASVTLAASLIRTYNSSGLAVLVPALQIFPQIQEADNLLDAPATQQLLLVRSTRTGVGSLSVFGHQFNSFVDGDYRAMITPNAGQTFPYTFVATSLGSECGQELFAPHTELIRVAGRAFFSGLSLGGAFNTEVIVNALPNGGQRERLSSLRIWAQAKVLGIRLPRFYFSNFSYHSPTDNLFAWDGLPGGTQPIGGQAGFTSGSGGFVYGILGLSAGVNVQVRLADEFCFVPRASALDVAVLNNESLRGQYANGVGTGSPAQAARFLAQNRFNIAGGAPRFNFQHPFFPARQAEWLFNEMQQRPQPGNLTCSNECSGLTITNSSGPGQAVCAGTTTVFGLSPAQPGTAITWTSSPAGLLSPASGTGPQFSTAAISGATGTVTIIATNSQGCELARTQVHVGAPDAPQLQVDISCNDFGGTVTIANYDPANQYVATGLNGVRFFGSNPRTITSPTFAFKTAGPGTSGSILLDVTSGCGTTSGSASVDQNCRQAQPEPTAALYPNPARETVDVRVENASAAQPVTVRLFDSYGYARAERTSTHSGAIRLQTATLPAGLYFVHLLRGNQVVSRGQLRIEK